MVRLRYGVPHIIFRVGNARGNFLWDPQIQLSYVFWEASPEGEIIQTVGFACCPWPSGIAVLRHLAGMHIAQCSEGPLGQLAPCAYDYGRVSPAE